jgi:hopanoid biosynthesis associated protein HpnK
MKLLIVNADDFGWTEGVNRGIVEAHRNGIVTSTSLLANGGAFRHAVELAGENPKLGVGVHLNLSDGPPILPRWEVPSLVNENGVFWARPASLFLRRRTGKLHLDEVEREWAAQIERIGNAGVAVTHLDGHKHVHMIPGLFAIALRLAQRYGIRAVRISVERGVPRDALAADGARATPKHWLQYALAGGLALLTMEAPELARRAGIAFPDYFCGLTPTGFLTKAAVESLLLNLPEGSTELMCHPGYADAALARSPTRLQRERQAELEALTAPEHRKIVAALRIHLINYAGLVSFQPVGQPASRSSAAAVGSSV